MPNYERFWESLTLVTKPNNSITIPWNLFPMSSYQQRQTIFVFLLQNKIWLLSLSHTKVHSLCINWKSLLSGSLPTDLLFRMLSVTCVCSNLWICISNGNLTDSNAWMEITLQMATYTTNMWSSTILLPQINANYHIITNLFASFLLFIFTITYLC